MKSISEQIFDHTLSISNVDDKISITTDREIISDDWINDKISAGNIGLLKGLSNPNNFRYKWSIFLINIFTIARNLLSYFSPISQLKDNQSIDPSIIIKYFKQDIEQIVFYIHKYRQLSNKINIFDKSYSIIFYFPNYFHHPHAPQLFREPNKNMKLTSIIYKILYNSINQKNYDVVYQIKDNQYYSYLYPMNYSSISLFKILKNYIKSSKRILLFSHIPIDYHLYKFFPTLHILNSYTGYILMNKFQIANKIFKTDTIPWNKYSHWLLGDKYVIQPHIPRGKKSELILLASQHNWKNMTDEQFKKQLIKMNYLDNSKYIYHPY